MNTQLLKTEKRIGAVWKPGKRMDSDNWYVTAEPADTDSHKSEVSTMFLLYLEHFKWFIASELSK